MCVFPAKVGNGLAQRIQPGSLERAYKYTRDRTMGITLHLWLEVCLVDLVEYQQSRHIGCPDLMQNLVDFCNLGITLRA